ncbi:MAG: exodeoxyribonuclease small subunit [Clostridia bacterium]|jgi:exodeoxyribonuclease VII small subunit|nr:exodeoxyribonuclease small subunit [Clostridia bacterium]MDN5323060.1 exodeoxyribonuclease small subunit [Clostridia bacterium]
MEEKLSYEDAVAKLEEIIKQLEQGEISLEKSINLFTEGINLVKTCNRYLNQAEEKIKVLLDDKLEDFSWSKEE